MYFWFISVAIWAVLLPIVLSRLVMLFVLADKFRVGRALLTLVFGIFAGLTCAATGYGVSELLLRTSYETYSRIRGMYDIFFGGVNYLGLEPTLMSRAKDGAPGRRNPPLAHHPKLPGDAPCRFAWVRSQG
jgi:hypothetical protein